MAKSLNAEEKTGVVEIGAEVGVLTKELCKTAGKVVGIELELLQGGCQGFNHDEIIAPAYLVTFGVGHVTLVILGQVVDEKLIYVNLRDGRQEINGCTEFRGHDF